MKIAIINNWPHNYMGGIETYSKELIKILINNGWEVHEFSGLSPDTDPICKPIKGCIQHNISKGAKFYQFGTNKKLNELIKDDTFDLIIGNSLMTKKAFYSNKYIHVQHMDKMFYSLKSLDTWFRIFNSLFLRLGSLKNPLKAKNVVLYGESHESNFGNRTFYIPLPLQSEYKFRDNSKKPKYIFWMARHEEPHKGLKNLSLVYKLSKNKDSFLIGGSGPDTNKINLPEHKIIGKLNKDEVISKFENSRVFVMTSNTEGFGFTIVEALSAGVPVVVFDTFTSVNDFNKCPSVFVIPKGNSKLFSETIDKICEMEDQEWWNLSQNAKKFAKKEFSLKKFEVNWLNLIDTVLKNQE